MRSLILFPADQEHKIVKAVTEVTGMRAIAVVGWLGIVAAPPRVGLEDRGSSQLSKPRQAAPEIASHLGPISQAICGGSERARKGDEIRCFEASTWSNALGFVSCVKRIPCVRVDLAR